MSRIGVLSLLTALLFLAGCGGPTTSTQPPAFTGTSPPAIVVPARTATSPHASPSVTQTARQAPVATATPAPAQRRSPTFTITPIPSDTPTAVPPGFNPLTGEIASDPDLLLHRPLAVKIVNEPACARPQYGLEQAAVVFEHYVEAWGTRFTAIYYGQEAGRIGAIRSARLIDLELPAIFDAGLVTSGSSSGVRLRLEQAEFADRVVSFQWQHQCPPLCLVPIETVPCADIEHTMFTNLRDLWAAAQGMGFDEAPQLSGWAFSDVAPPGGQPAASVQVGYLNSPVDWRFEPENGNYHRWQDGVRHVAAETRRRLTARNVVVLFAHHLYTDIRESPNFYSLEIQFWGQGPALIFRDGRAYHATWLRSEREGLFQLLDTAGNPIPLKPGRTWFQFVALDSPVGVTDDSWTITAAVLPQQTPPR